MDERNRRVWGEKTKQPRNRMRGREAEGKGTIRAGVCRKRKEGKVFSACGGNIKKKRKWERGKKLSSIGLPAFREPCKMVAGDRA